MMCSPPTEHERDKALSSTRRTRKSGSSVENKLATWGDVPGQRDIFEVIEEDREFVGHNHPDTAQAMAASFRTGTLRETVYRLITQHNGLTDYDLEDITGRSHQSVSGTRNSLVKDGLVTDSGVRRRNRFDNDVIVWRAT